MNIIEIHNLSKKYVIGHDKAASGMYKYSSLRDSIAHTCRGMVQRIRHPLSPNTETTALEEFWALKDINLEIEQGDKVGIIGRNGAGKSTLLKVLSRITEPTSGNFTIKGRIASLLEVGTGFHPELSGRENIYLNGAVLGMTRKEIKKKFDEIVDFSGVEKFLDTPVKRFSSGMYVRLAFAVAAHLDPEILLIDEVLAVGDAEFQKKCLGKMDEVSKQGRTILFVSHNMEAIRSLCSKTILLSQGAVESTGDSNEVIDKYFLNIAKNITSKKQVEIAKIKEAQKNKPSKKILFQDVQLFNSNENEISVFRVGEDITIKTTIIINEKISFPVFGAIVYSENGIYLGGINSLSDDTFDTITEAGCYEVEYKLRGLFLQGRYLLTLVIHDKTGKIIYDIQDRSYSFTISGNTNTSSFSGIVKIPCNWQCKKISL